MKKIITMGSMLLMSSAINANALPIGAADPGSIVDGGIVDTSAYFSFDLGKSTGILAGSVSVNPGRTVPTLAEVGSYTSASTNNWSPVLYNFFAWSGYCYRDWDRDGGWWKPQPISGPAPDQGGNPVPVPEPATLLLFGTGMLALAGISRRGRQHEG